MKKKARRRIASRPAPRKLASERSKLAPPVSSEFVSEAVRDAMKQWGVSPEPARNVDAKEPGATVPKTRPPDGLTAVVGAAFEAAITAPVRRRLQHGQALAAVILVPTAAWVDPMAKFFRANFGTRWVVCARDGSNKSTHKESVGSREMASDLGRGLCVMGIAADLGVLPRALVVAADITVRIEPPTAPVLRTAITRFARRAPQELPDGIAAGLDLDEIVAAFRPRTGPQRIADRLAATATTMRGEVTDERLPDLETAVEYGAARDFALSLKKEVEDYRAKRITWEAFANKALICHGEPGTGKSLLFRAVGRLCGIPVVITSVADWLGKSAYLDHAIQSMRASFQDAISKANPCCLLVLEECDAVPNRFELARRDSRNADYWGPLLAELLLNCEAASPTRRGIILGAATNRLSAVDPALLRPGRFERAIEIVRPDFAGTLSMLKFHVAGDIADSELTDIAAAVERSTGAEIMLLVREGRRIARHAGRQFSAEDLRAAVIQPDTMPPEIMWRVCVHEAGHVVSAMALSFLVRHCVANARTGEQNRTLIDFGNQGLPTRDIIEHRVTVFLAGRSAERELLGNISAGCESDVATATEAIGSLHLTYGMAGTVAHLAPSTRVLDSLRFDERMRDRVEKDLQRLQRRADEVIARHCAAVVAIAEALRDRKFLTGDAVRAIFEANKPAYLVADDNAEVS